MTGDYHSPAYYLAGKAVYAVKKSRPLAALDISEPDRVLAAARNDICNTLATITKASTYDQRRALEPELMALAVGASSQRSGAARSLEWDAATAPLLPTIAMRDARRFVSNHFSEIQRLARTLLSERRLSVGMVCWLLDSKPQRRAA